MTDVAVKRDDEKNVYEARLYGRTVGRAYFRTRPGRVVFTHTKIDPEHEGEGIGSALARGALDDVRARGLRAVPECEFIAGYIEEHQAYADLVAT